MFGHSDTKVFVQLQNLTQRFQSARSHEMICKAVIVICESYKKGRDKEVAQLCNNHKSFVLFHAGILLTDIT